VESVDRLKVDDLMQSAAYSRNAANHVRFRAICQAMQIWRMRIICFLSGANEHHQANSFDHRDMYSWDR
jgi:hypothetical protein